MDLVIHSTDNMDLDRVEIHNPSLILSTNLEGHMPLRIEGGNSLVLDGAKLDGRKFTLRGTNAASFGKGDVIGMPVKVFTPSSLIGRFRGHLGSTMSTYLRISLAESGVDPFPCASLRDLPP